MSQGRPQFYQNSLDVPHITKEVLQAALGDLRTAVINGVGLIETADPPSGHYDGKGIFSGQLGIALAYLRLAQQAPSLAEDVETLPAFRTLASQRIPAHGPNLPLMIGGLSPLSSNTPLTAVVLRVLQKAAVGRAATISDTDLACLNEAVELALSHGPLTFYHGHKLGADEVLYGRAGLLWALLNIRARISDFPAAQLQFLSTFLQGIPKLVDVIIASGREGAGEYIKSHGEREALPLMWTWMPGHYGFGIVHGLTGIISILLACRPEELDNSAHNYFPEIAATITGICRICIAHNGHLPTMIPPRSGSSPTSHLVQICHGSPAILTLLGCAMKCIHVTLHHWQPEWDQAARLAAERVWEEGLLSKGGGLCHGIAGNAWPFLLLHDAFEYNKNALNRARENYMARWSPGGQPKNIEDVLTGDYFLSRAIPMLLHARETRPYNRSPEKTSNDYRMPDNPYSLFEGLSGTLCAWAECCAVINARLRKIHLDEEGATVEHDGVFKECILQQLGFPCVGGNGPTGLL